VESFLRVLFAEPGKELCRASSKPLTDLIGHSGQHQDNIKTTGLCRHRSARALRSDHVNETISQYLPDNGCRLCEARSVGGSHPYWIVGTFLRRRTLVPDTGYGVMEELELCSTVLAYRWR